MEGGQGWELQGPMVLPPDSSLHGQCHCRDSERAPGPWLEPWLPAQITGSLVILACPPFSSLSCLFIGQTQQVEASLGSGRGSGQAGGRWQPEKGSPLWHQACISCAFTHK